MDASELPSATSVTDVVVDGAIPWFTHPGWRDRHPWMAQGITARGDGSDPFDLALFGDAPGAAALRRWERLRAAVGARSAVHARQPHGTVVRHHREGPPGLHVAESCDGHLTRSPGVVLGVTVADCVPVTLVHPATRSVAVLHAGWRGTAAGIIRSGVAAFRDRLGVSSDELEAHLGPSICGFCYEVGPEVHARLGLVQPPEPAPVDVRRVLARDLRDAGLAAARVTASTWCTRCGDTPFFSHRGGGPAASGGLGGPAPVMDARVGLCSACRHVRVTGNRRGSRFHLCGRSADDPRFPKYPRLPVLRCSGFQPMEDPGPDQAGPSTSHGPDASADGDS